MTNITIEDAKAMCLTQISVFIENRQGSLLKVTRCLAANDIDIRALSAADASDHCLLRLILNKPELAYAALKAARFTVLSADVVAVAAKDTPGGLNYVLETLDNAGVRVEYLYAFFSKEEASALNIIKLNKMAEGVAALMDAGVCILSPDEVYSR